MSMKKGTVSTDHGGNDIVIQDKSLHLAFLTLSVSLPFQDFYFYGQKLSCRLSGACVKLYDKEGYVDARLLIFWGCGGGGATVTPSYEQTVKALNTLEMY